MKSIIVLLTLVWTTCISAELKPPTPPQLKLEIPPPPEAQAPKVEVPVVEKPELNPTKIVTIRDKDQIIQIKNNGAESLYTVKDRKGKVLADNLTMAQLEAKNPKIAKKVKDAVASQGKLDARVD